HAAPFDRARPFGARHDRARRAAELLICVGAAGREPAASLATSARYVLAPGDDGRSRSPKRPPMRPSTAAAPSGMSRSGSPSTIRSPNEDTGGVFGRKA